MVGKATARRFDKRSLRAPRPPEIFRLWNYNRLAPLTVAYSSASKAAISVGACRETEF
jgi:hypothetical protein